MFVKLSCRTRNSPAPNAGEDGPDDRVFPFSLQLHFVPKNPERTIGRRRKNQPRPRAEGATSGIWSGFLQWIGQEAGLHWPGVHPLAASERTCPDSFSPRPNIDPGYREPREKTCVSLHPAFAASWWSIDAEILRHLEQRAQPKHEL